ncbi:BNR repeat domain protein [Minicystis rosea]|nr:BNR repeat domain protein [Minicystis rosea]
MPRISVFLSFFSLSLVACGSSTGGTGGAGGTGSSSSGSSTTSSSSGTGGSATTSSSTGTGGSTPVASCSEIDATDCFSNLDCMSADRCENKGPSDTPVPCCVPGARGTGKLGASCTVDNDCATSLCIETSAGFQCSGECQSDTDCTTALPSCTEVPAILGQGSFCFPEG